MNEEELEDWAKGKVVEWVNNLNKEFRKGRYLSNKGYCYLLAKALKYGYHKALEDIDKKE